MSQLWREVPGALPVVHVDEIWPSGPSPPKSVHEAGDGPFSLGSRGVEIRKCLDDPVKGLGAFAIRNIPARSVIGVYWGEKLTVREFNLRHGWNESSGGEQVVATPAEMEALAERRLRLESLGVGAPIDGADNGGSYCFSVLRTGTDPREATADQIAYIDAEDPNRSSWARYINSAEGGSDTCNATSHVNAEQQLVWFTATRDIRPGEEIAFDYYDTEICEIETPHDARPRQTVAPGDDAPVAEAAALPSWRSVTSIVSRCGCCAAICVNAPVPSWLRGGDLLS